MRKLLLFASVLIVLFVAVWALWPGEEVDYNSQVKPILNQHCISCHGGVKQSGGFSLLFEELAKGNTDSGSPAIAPGHPGKSEMIRLLVSDDPDERMPFEKEPLDKREIRILKRWIKQGARWDTHWSYVPVQQVVLPTGHSSNDHLQTWKRNDIDHFIYAKAVEQGLQVSTQAETAVLARRMSFDLIGMPPPVDLVDNLLENPTEESWKNYIQELLDSKHYGEKWAALWMDLARYSDTKGYERDAPRTIWRYRDWLISAFNQDMPYDQFITEQIAGDLLPERTDEQLIATAFHRNTMTNDEGGTDNEEFRTAAVMDRVNTTWDVLMGTTFSCVQCHGHPYDPFGHEDYFRFMAYFNNSRDEDTFDDYPVLRHFEKEDSLQLAELKNWLQNNSTPDQMHRIIDFLKTWQPSINSLTSVDFVNAELADTKWLVFRNNGSSRLKRVNLDGKSKLIYRYKSFLPGGIWMIQLDSINGQVLKQMEVDFTRRNWAFNEIEIPKVDGTHDLVFSYHNPNLKNPGANGLQFDWFHFTEPFPGINKPGYDQAKEKFWYLLTRRTDRTPIMVENPVDMRRETRLFERGNWLTPGMQVAEGVPEVLNPLPEDVPNNRLALAQWLVSTENPLTARTYVNRIWEQLFGKGIVETTEDLGSQGIPPVNRELLDHLAWKFMYDFNWSTKELLQFIISSATYQQSSYTKPEQEQRDPENRFCSRGPRIRLTAEQIRDQALVVSGLFNPKMYGPSVMPYQPDGIWNSPYSGAKWEKNEDGNQYRRALYTYWKRTSPYPSMILFDAMAREVCAVRRITTNTPLQALVTLNDSVYVEASDRFARRMIAEGGSTPEEQISHGYRLMMYKPIAEEKLEVLLDLYSRISEGNVKNEHIETLDNSGEERHLQAMQVVANTLFNLDEFIVKN